MVNSGLFDEVEGVLYELAGQLPIFPPDTDHVEAGRPIVQIVFAEKVSCDACDLSLFAAIDGFERIAEAFLGPGFHFDEHHRVAVPGDQVDFARGAAVVALEDAIALPFEVLLGGTLAYGFTGLFLGPIVLAVIWELMATWIKEQEGGAGEAEP